MTILTDDLRVNFTLSGPEAHYLLVATRSYLRREEKALARSGFIPPPGRRNGHAVRVEALSSVFNKIRSAVRNVEDGLRFRRLSDD